MIDAESYGISALLLARVRGATRAQAPRQRFGAELREGFAEVRKRTWVWAIIASAAFWNLLSAFSVLGPVVAKHSLGGPAAWAAILSAEGIGWLAGLFSGVAMMLFNTLFETMLQQHVPQHALSRVSSFDWFGSLAFQPLGLALMGPLASAVGLSAALYLCAGLKLVTLGSLLAVRDIRTLGPFPDCAALAETIGLLNERGEPITHSRMDAATRP